MTDGNIFWTSFLTNPLAGLRLRLYIGLAFKSLLLELLDHRWIDFRNILPSEGLEKACCRLERRMGTSTCVILSKDV